MLAWLMLGMLQMGSAAVPPSAEATKNLRAEEAGTIRQAQALAREGKPAELIALLDPLIAREDAAAAAEKRRTFSSQSLPMLLANLATAAKDKQGAVDAGPAYAEAVYLKGYALLELGRYAEAEPFYTRAIALSPFNARYHNEYGFWLRKGGKLDAALDQYKQAEGLSGVVGDDAVAAKLKAAALRGQGYVLIDLDRLDEAEARYRASLALDPDSQVARNDLAVIAQRRKRPPKNKV